MQAIIYNHSLTITFACGTRTLAGVWLIKEVNGIKNVRGGIKAASFKITRKEKKKKNVQKLNEVNEAAGGEGSRDCVNQAEPCRTLFVTP